MEIVKKDTEHFTMKDLLYKPKKLTTLYMPLKIKLMLIPGLYFFTQIFQWLTDSAYSQNIVVKFALVTFMYTMLDITYH